MSTNISRNGINFIKQHEGCRLKAYQDTSGYWTIGYGHKIVSGDGFNSSSVITQTQADNLFDTDVQNKAVTYVKPYGSKLTQNEFDAVCSITFNCGPKVVTSSDMQTLINNPYIDPAFIGPIPQNSLVNNAFNWGPFPTLGSRRNAEMALFCQDCRLEYKPY